MVIDYVEDLGMKRAEQTKAESFDGFEGIMFYATPDMLSGLCGWAFFDTNAADAVVTRFGSGCSSVVSMTIVENARQGQRCFMGLLDPSVRPYVGTNELSFTIPMSREHDGNHERVFPLRLPCMEESKSETGGVIKYI